MEKNRESLPLDRKVTSRDVARVAGVSGMITVKYTIKKRGSYA